MTHPTHLSMQTISKLLNAFHGFTYRMVHALITEYNNAVSSKKDPVNPISMIDIISPSLLTVKFMIKLLNQKIIQCFKNSYILVTANVNLRFTIHKNLQLDECPKSFY